MPPLPHGGRDRVGDCRKGPVGTGPAGSVFGENSFCRETRGTKRGGRHVAKRKPRIAYPEVKVHVRNLMRVVGFVAPFAPQVVGTQESRRPVPGAPRSGTPLERQAKYRDVTVWKLCRRVLWVPGPLGKYSAIIVLSRNLAYKTRGVAMWLNVVLNDRRVAYLEVKVQVRDLVRVVNMNIHFISLRSYIT